MIFHYFNVLRLCLLPIHKQAALAIQTMLLAPPKQFIHTRVLVNLKTGFETYLLLITLQIKIKPLGLSSLAVGLLVLPCANVVCMHHALRLLLLMAIN